MSAGTLTSVTEASSWRSEMRSRRSSALPYHTSAASTTASAIVPGWRGSSLTAHPRAAEQEQLDQEVAQLAASPGRRAAGRRRPRASAPRSSETTTATASVSSLMPSAARWREPYSVDRSARAGQRQEAARRRDAVALHHGGAVVQRRARGEEVDQQVVRQPGVDRDAGLDEGAQPLVALDDDERAVAPRHQRLAGQHDVVDQHLARRERATPSAAAASARRPRGSGGSRAGTPR